MIETAGIPGRGDTVPEFGSGELGRVDDLRITIYE